MKAGGTPLWPVRCAPVGNVAVGSVLWRHTGQLYCTAIVKVSLALPAQGVMTRINPSPLRRSDDYLHGKPSLAGGGECAPRMDLAEAVIVGHAYANPRASKRSVRFTMVRGDKILIDKTLYVYGDRVKGGAPAPFRKVRLSWERALGGLDYPANPIGVGMDADSSRRPNIIDPRSPKRRPAGFGPYPARFMRRRQYRGDVPLELIEGGIADYPPDFAWKYFQAAPSDQRIAEIRGDEWILLEGLHRDHERIRARLPHAKAYARIYARKDVGVPDWVDLRATILHIEPDDDRCSLVFRGHFPVASELAAKELVIAGAVQCGREPVVWPDGLEALDMYASPKVPSMVPIAGQLDDSLMRTAVSAGRAPPPQRNLGLGYRLGDQKMAIAAPPVPVALMDAEVLDDVDVIEEDAPPDMPYSDIPPPPSYRGRISTPGPWPAIPPPAPLPPADPSDLYGSYAYSAAHSYPSHGHVDPSAEHPLSSTDEMEDPEAEAAADAGIRRFEATEIVSDPDEG